MATRKLRITESLLLGIGSGRYEVIANPLPVDVSIVSREIDELGVIHLLIESPEFSETEDGPTPEWSSPIIRRITEPERPRVYHTHTSTYAILDVAPATFEDCRARLASIGDEYLFEYLKEHRGEELLIFGAVALRADPLTREPDVFEPRNELKERVGASLDALNDGLKNFSSELDRASSAPAVDVDWEIKP